MKLLRTLWKNKKYICYIVGSIFIVALFVLLMILVLNVIKKLKIEIIGNQEMWIGLIGALMGGVLTLVGVIITIDSQKIDEKERIRIENMPILKIDWKANSLRLLNISRENCGFFTVDENRIYSSDFPKDYTKFFPLFNISLANSCPAFDVYIDSCITCKYQAEAFDLEFYTPNKYRIINNEAIKILFWIKDYDKYESSNVFCIIRIAYSDIFLNKYYQDVPFWYNENCSNDSMIEIDNIRTPVLASEAPLLKEIINEEFKDYMEEIKSNT